MENLILKIDSLKKEIDNYRPIQEERMSRIMQKLRLEWNYHSNSIEGNTLTRSETKAFLSHHKLPELKPNPDLDIVNDLLTVCEKQEPNRQEWEMVRKGDSTILNDLLDIGDFFYNIGGQCNPISACTSTQSQLKATLFS